MSDPTFTTRAALDAWVAETASKARTPAQMLAALPHIKRVMLAHLHLPEIEKE